MDNLYEPKRIGARSLGVKYRMHDEFYPEIDEMGHHDMDEGGIIKLFYLILDHYTKYIQEFLQTENNL